MDGITTMEQRIEERNRAIERERKRREKGKCISVTETAEILRNRYKLRVPHDFVARAKKKGDVKPITEKDVNEIMRIANFWKPALDEEGFDEFVVAMVADFFFLRSVAINNNPNCGYYIGKKAKLRNGVEGIIPILKTDMITTVLSSGGNAAFAYTSSRWHFED